MNKQILILVFMFTAWVVSTSQAVAVQVYDTGRSIKVLDTDGEGLPGARISFTCIDSCENSGNKTISLIADKEGTSSVPYYGSVKLEISYLGYKSIVDTLASDIDEAAYRLQLHEYLTGDIITTAQFAPVQSADAVQKVKIISEERIERQGAFSLREVLMAEAGIQVNQDGITGTGISINGISGQNIKILIDGVPIVGRIDGQIDISQINLSNIERIEIIEGPVSALYGSDALGGVVNLITKKGTNEELDFYLNSRHETIGGEVFQAHEGIYNLDAGLGFKVSDVDMRLSGGRNFFGGLESETGTRRQIWNPKEQYMADLSASYPISEKGRLSFLSSFFNETLINKGNVIEPFGETAFDDYFYTDRLQSSLQYQGEALWGGQLNTVLSYSYFNRIRSNEIKNLVTLESRPVNDPTQHDTTVFDNVMFRTFYSFPKTDFGTELRLGLELNHDRAVGERIGESGDQEVQDYSALISLSQEWGDLTVVPALRLIQNSLYEAPLVPSVSAQYKLGDFNIRSSMATGFRAPSLKELYLLFVDVNHNVVGNPNLRAETSINFSFNLDYQTMLGKANDLAVLKFGPKVFYNRISDMISLNMDANDPTLYSYFNLDDFTSQGAGLEVSFLNDDLSINSSVIVIGRSSSLAEGILYTPEVDLNASYSFGESGYSLSMNGKYTGVRPFYVNVSDEILQYEIPDFINLDMSGTYQLTDDMNVILGARNLLNVTSLDTGVSQGGVHSSGSSSTPISWGRSFYLGFSYN